MHQFSMKSIKLLYFYLGTFFTLLPLISVALAQCDQRPHDGFQRRHIPTSRNLNVTT